MERLQLRLDGVKLAEICGHGDNDLVMKKLKVVSWGELSKK
jgi:hypothetical protein